VPSIPQGHINYRGAVALLLTYNLTKAFLVFPERMSKGAQTAAWLVPILSAAVSVLWLWALVAVLKAHPGQSIIAITNSLASPVVGVILGVVFFIYNVGLVSTGGREIADALVTVILPLTPVVLILILMYAVATYIALIGLENLARVCIFGVTSIVGLVVLLSVLSINEWRWDSVFPLLGPGLAQLGKVSLVRQAVYSEIMALGIFASYLRKSEDTGRAARRALLVSALTLSLVVLNCQMVFPYPSLAEIPVPFLRVTRLIFIGRFFQRFDALLVPVWLAAGVLKLSVGIMVGALALGCVTGLRSLKLLIPVTALLSLTASILIPSFALTIYLDFDIVRPYSVFLLDIWAPGLLALDLLKRRRAKGGSPAG
jgi:spore germination protein (amino acid permease)